MRIIKLAVISVVIFSILALVISLLLPSQITISRAIDISATKDKVMQKMGSTENWQQWIENKDSLAVTSSSNKFTMGNTTAQVLSLQNNTIKTAWRVGEGRILPSEFNIIDQPEAEHLTVQWKFDQRVKWYPWEKIASIISDKVLGQFMEASLDNLKQISESDSTGVN